MAESYPSDAVLNALSGTSDAEQEVYFPAVREKPYYTGFYRMLSRLLLAAARAGDLRAYKDGALTFGVRAGRYMNGAAAVDYAGAAEQALTNNATNYVYLTAAGVLTVNTTGFPAAGTTPHVPLAEIPTAAGSYEVSDIVDYRGRAILSCVSALSPSMQNGLVALCPAVSITAAAEAGDARRVTVQALDLAGSALAQRFRLRVWIATADYGAPDATDNTFGLVTGTELRELTADADYELITDAAGKAQFDLTISGAASRFILAELDGRIYSSGELTWAA